MTPPRGLATGAWVLAGRIAPQASGLVLLVLGGRALDPESLGSFVLVLAGVELLRQLVRAGWREAVLTDASGAAMPTLLALALAAGLAVQPLILAAALLAPRILPTPGIGTAILVCGAALAPIGAAAIWEGVLLRRGEAARAARPLVIAELVQATTAALLLAAGYGILALAAGRALRAVALALGLAAAAGWPCAVSFRLAPARAVLPVAGHVTTASLLGFAGSSGADLIVGVTLGPAGVAAYRVAARISGAVADVVSETVRVLVWSSLAGRGPLDAAATTALFRRVLALSLPVLVGLALVAAPLVAFLLGPVWAPAAPALALLALARLLQLPATLAAPVLAGHGATRALPRIAVVLTLATLAGTLAAGRFGLLAVAGAQLAAAAAGLAAALVLVRRTVPGVRLLPDAATLAALAGMALAVAAAGRAAPGALALPLQAGVGALIWGGFLLVRQPGARGA